MAEEKKTYTAKIYKIVCSCCDKIYVGSTKNRLSRRLSQHKADSRKLTQTRKLCVHMREVGVDNFQILQLAAVEVKDKEELRAIEDRYIRELRAIEDGFNQHNAVFNEQTKKATQRRHYVNNKEVKYTYNKQVREENKTKKRFYCVLCDHTAMCNAELGDHLKSIRHLENEKGVKKYACEVCKYSTDNKSNSNTHFKSKKHRTKFENSIFAIEI